MTFDANSQAGIGLDERPGIDGPSLLVSVRSRHEFHSAAAAGVDIVDLKEPQRGPLAPTDPGLWRYAAKCQFRPQPAGTGEPMLSAALGELPEALTVASQLPGSFAFAKAGPSGCRDVTHLRQSWAQIRERLDHSIELVAVAYADFEAAGCPDPETVIRAAVGSGFRRCLIDTFIKDGRSTLDHLGMDGLSRCHNFARQANLWWALAGSITAACMESLGKEGISPDCVGLRGDVCDDGRTGNLSEVRIRSWKQLLASTKSA